MTAVMDDSTRKKLKRKMGKTKGSVKRFELIKRIRKGMLIVSAVMLVAYGCYVFIIFPELMSSGHAVLNWINFSISIAYIVFYPWFILFRYGRRLREFSQDVVFYASVRAAEQLENGDPIKASAWVNKLMEVFPYFIAQKSVLLDIIRPARLKDILYFNPRLISRRAVLGAIQNSKGEMAEFSRQFYNFAQGISSKKDRDIHVSTQDFLSWLFAKSGKFELKPAGFWERNPGLRDFLPVIGVIIVAVVQIIVGIFG